jgi:mannose-6-phosphate isomerase-like protein (cupin superfamily)
MKSKLLLLCHTRKTDPDPRRRTLSSGVARRRGIVPFALLFCALPLMAADPPGFVVWSASDVKGIDKKLSAKVDEHKFSSQQLDKWGNHYAMVAHREGDGVAELHETESDIFVVQSGTATLIVGGEMVDGKTTAPNEVRGASIKNGTEHKLGPGDIVHIPPKVPHQVLVGKGKFTYFVVKVGQ